MKLSERRIKLRNKIIKTKRRYVWSKAPKIKIHIKIKKGEIRKWCKPIAEAVVATMINIKMMINKTHNISYIYKVFNIE